MLVYKCEYRVLCVCVCVYMGWGGILEGLHVLQVAIHAVKHWMGELGDDGECVR